MNSKRAQSEIITTVLIILLVLAAIIIVWQVVQGTVKSGGDTATEQANCVNIGFDVTRDPADATGTQFIVKRQSSGDSITNSSSTVLTMAVLVNGFNAVKGATTLNYTFVTTGTSEVDFKDPLIARIIKIGNTSAITKMEVALKVNNDICGATGVWTA